MTNQLAAVLSRTITACSIAEPARMEAAAHGTVELRCGFVRREVIVNRIDGEVPMLKGEPIASITEEDAPEVEQDDLLWVSGKLWAVQSALADGVGLVKLQLKEPEASTVRISGRDVEVFIAGNLNFVERGGTFAALTRSRMAPGPAELGRDKVTVLDAAFWGDGWDRIVVRLEPR